MKVLKRHTGVICFDTDSRQLPHIQ